MRNLSASPRHMSASPVQRYSPNSAYITTATHRMNSPSTPHNKVTENIQIFNQIPVSAYILFNFLEWVRVTYGGEVFNL